VLNLHAEAVISTYQWRIWRLLRKPRNLYRTGRKGIISLLFFYYYGDSIKKDVLMSLNSHPCHPICNPFYAPSTWNVESSLSSRHHLQSSLLVFCHPSCSSVINHVDAYPIIPPIMDSGNSFGIPQNFGIASTIFNITTP